MSSFNIGDIKQIIKIDKTEISLHTYTLTHPLCSVIGSVVWLRINHHKKLFSRNEGPLLVSILGDNRITETLLAIPTHVTG